MIYSGEQLFQTKEFCANSNPMYEFYARELACIAIREKRKLYSPNFVQMSIAKEAVDKLIAIFTTDEFEVVTPPIKNMSGRGINSHAVFYSPGSGCFSLVCYNGCETLSNNGEIQYINTNLSGVTFSKELVEHFQKFFEENQQKESNSSFFSVIVANSGGLETKRLKIDEKQVFEEGNYTPEQVEIFREFCHNVKDPNPRGRLLLLSGKPGTGKTYFIQGLVSELKNCEMLILPTNAVASITSPELMDMLLEKGEEETCSGSSEPRQLILILEDADSCLVPRNSENISLISSLLNLSDGILGRGLNLFIVATTNARINEIDPAVSRPGRMFAQIEIDELQTEHAERVYRRLTGVECAFSRPITLAEVYEKSYELKKKKIVSAGKTGNGTAKGIGF